MARPAYTKSQRQARWKQLAGYIRRTETLPEAIALAKREHVVAPTSAWISALGRCLLERCDLWRG